eukprot:TRINITY_DN6224_c0_g1_i4.p1 TRINITY_DN6224_c0_g1~~TRINITY_DN6224_c0_g1_i4.p1  ORF type:complete len:237 (-),score=46.27 TRINITY_DN6224_c0_g1_i4:1108-1818(-)
MQRRKIVQFAAIPRICLSHHTMLENRFQNSGAKLFWICHSSIDSETHEIHTASNQFQIWLRDKASHGDKVITQFANTTKDRNSVSAFKYSVGQVVRSLLNSITFEEKMLRNMPHNSEVESVVVRVPSDISLDEARSSFKELVSSNARFHQLWLSVNLCALPFTAAAGIIPGPNIFLFWNLLRSYSHRQALDSSKFLVERLAQEHVEFVLDPELKSFLQGNADRSIHDFGTYLHNLE